MRVAVAGGTGMVGVHVVAALQAGGHDPVVLSRSRGVDVRSGSGLAAALDGVEAVVDVSNVATSAKRPAVEFFSATARTLLAAEQAAGVRHHVALSIVGVDRVPFGYYQGKLAQERVVAEGPVPWTVVRATQFHEFPGQLLARFRGPLVPVPRMRSATVSAREVGEHLAALAVAEPAGMAQEFAGPEVHDMLELARRLARGSRRLVVGVRLPGRTGAQMAGDGLLPVGADALRGRQTFDEWLAEQGPRAQ